MAREPDLLAEQIAQLTLDIHSRSGDPIKTVQILGRILPQLIPHIADNIFIVELERFFPKLRPEHRSGFLNTLYKSAFQLDPEGRITLLRAMVEKMSKLQLPEEQLAGDI